MSAFRTAIVAIAVLVLVPAWVARSTYVYLCGSAAVAVAHATPCCPSAKPSKQPRRAPEPLAKPACCAADEVDLAARAAGAAHVDAALAPPPRAVALVAAPLVEPARPRAAIVAPRATGPPTYLRTLQLLI